MSEIEHLTILPAKCVNCALVKHSVSEYSSFEAEHVVSYFVPAAFFLFLSLRWSFLLLTRWKKFASDHQLELAGLPPTPEVGNWTGCSTLCGRPLPWEGLVKIMLSTTAIGVTLVLLFDLTNLMLITMYGFFLISGLIDLLVYFCGYLVLPEGIQSLILSFCFIVEGLAFYSLSSASTLHLHLLLLFLILACSVSSILELVYEARLIKYCRCFFTLLQSSWLFHTGSLVGNEEAINFDWASIYFTWHLGLGFLLTILILVLITERVKSVPTYIIPSMTTSLCSSPGGSPAHLVTGQFLQIAKRPTSLPVFQTTFKTTRSEPLGKTDIIDMEPWDIL
eukprot:TRINITY_DN13800_c0_g1_i2.p1 TRINITY_DN13800_c0_g1~~TRINITY_DN13800_c0_g1_i2.p1  ORF type:complete len:336 (-),score=13.13 TRINITY_DN13800_c0_g1_i2:30-1037(-)